MRHCIQIYLKHRNISSELVVHAACWYLQNFHRFSSHDVKKLCRTEMRDDVFHICWYSLNHLEGKKMPSRAEERPPNNPSEIFHVILRAFSERMERGADNTGLEFLLMQIISV